MNNEILKNIDKFISSVKNEFSEDIVFNSKYNELDDMYEIWHNYVNFEDPSFKKILGKNAYEHFLNNGIFNVSIAYREDFANIIAEFIKQTYFSEIRHLILKFEKELEKTKFNINTNSIYISHQFYINNINCSTEYQINNFDYGKTPNQTRGGLVA